MQRTLAATRRSARERNLQRVLALLLTCLFTWPLIREVPGATRLLDPGLDDYVHYWNHWWVHRALFVLHRDPLFCPEIYHPWGASLALSPLCLPLALASLPLQAALSTLHGSAVAVKLALFASFPVALLGMARLLRRVLGISPWVAFLAGVWFAFSPFRLLHLGRVHYEAGALVPWFLERLFAALTRPPGAPWRGPALQAGLLLALAGAADPSLLPELVWASGALLLVVVRRSPHPLRACLARAAVAGGSGVVLLLPLLVPMVQELRSNPGTDVVSELRFTDHPDPVQLRFSPDANNLAWYLAPALHETLFGPGSAAAQGSRENRHILDTMHGGRPATAFEGLVAAALLLVLLAAWVAGVRRTPWPLVVLTVVGLALALGPFRRIGGRVWPMPFWVLANVVPGLAAGRYVATHLRLFYLGAGAVAAVGAERWPRGVRGGLGGLALLAALGPLVRPFRYAEIRHEPVMRVVAEDPAPGALLDLPHDVRINLRRMALGQILHERPLGGGPVTRVRPDVRRAFEEGLRVVRRFEEPPAPRDPADPELVGEAAENVRQLREFGYRYVLVRGWILRDPERRERLAAYLAAHRGLTRREVDGHWLLRVEDP